MELQTLRSEPHAEMGRLIERDAEIIIDNWLSRARQDQPAAASLHREELRDGLPDFLREVGCRLAQPQAEAVGRGFCLAAEHGERRWREGWKLDELVRDYQTLRFVIMEHLEEGRNRPLELREIMAVGAFLDDAIVAATAAYSAYEDAYRRESEMRNTAVFATAMDCIITIDQEGRILEFNRAAEETFGYKSSDVLGGQIAELLIPSEFRERHYRGMEHYRSTGEGPYLNQRNELTGMRSDGSEFPIELTITRIPTAGPPLFTGFVRDITQRKQAEESLLRLTETLEEQVADRTAVAQHQAEQLRRLALELTRAEERERRRLAEILHDHAQQLLVAAKWTLGSVRGKIGDETIRASLHGVDELLNESIETLRSLAVELQPPALYSAGLPAALEWLARQMREKHGLAVEIEGEVDPPRDDLRVLLYTAIRELLFNAAKHAGVDRARVELRSLEREWIQVTVADEGAGFDPAVLRGDASEDSFGLFSIQARLNFIGGKLEIDTAPGKGTRVTLTVSNRQLTP